ncbi:MAG: CAP domain-containing protein [Bacteroidales bacterium]|nr:CAP domain-containing protein [Bacteroidales bacterium]
MVRSLLVPLLLLLPAHLSSQESVWDRWDAEVVQKLNTAGEAGYMTEEEKKVILFINMARHDGSLFAETFLETYMKTNDLENSRYIRSLFRDLKKLPDLLPLEPGEDLTAVAQGHAIKSGKTGHVGHIDFNKRFKPLMGNPYQHVGENCSYGYEEAIDIVITLLIDEGIKEMGHRKNILNKSFNSVGVAIRPHKKYRVNCVMDFGRQTRSSLNEVPY